MSGDRAALLWLRVAINRHRDRVTTPRLWRPSDGSTTISNRCLGGKWRQGTGADERGQHQHALLNLANFYYSTGGLDSAKAVSAQPSGPPIQANLIGNRRSSQSFACRRRQSMSSGMYEVSRCQRIHLIQVCRSVSAPRPVLRPLVISNHLALHPQQFLRADYRHQLHLWTTYGQSKRLSIWYV